MAGRLPYLNRLDVYLDNPDAIALSTVNKTLRSGNQQREQMVFRSVINLSKIKPREFDLYQNFERDLEVALKLIVKNRSTRDLNYIFDRILTLAPNSSIRELDVSSLSVIFGEHSSQSLTSHKLKSILNFFQSLEKINLTNCLNISNPRLENERPNLKEINFRFSSITDEGLKNILQLCPNLEKINLSDCSDISNPGLENELPNLKEINLSNSSITDEGVRTRPKSFLPNKQQPHKRQFNHCERGGELSLAVLPKSSAFF